MISGFEVRVRLADSIYCQREVYEPHRLDRISLIQFDLGECESESFYSFCFRIACNLMLSEFYLFFRQL